MGHKSKLGKFKKIKIIPSIFSDHNALRLDLNYRRKTIKNSNIWKLNNTLLNNQQITEEIKKEIKLCTEMSENENTKNENVVGHCKSSAKGKVHSNTGIPQETRKKSINNLTLYLKQLEKEEMKNLRVNRREILN